jgi:transposase InsO family protein
MMRSTRLLRTAIVLNPSAIMSFHRALVKQKYRLLLTPRKRGKPGPKGPSPELIDAILEMKRRNPRFGYQRIAQELTLAFGVEIDKDTVRRGLAKHYRPDPSNGGASWLTFLAHAKDSLWSVDLFRCESLILRSHWVMVVMDQFTRRIIGFAVCAGAPDGPTVCRMFGEVRGHAGSLPNSLSSDHDPLFEFHRWKANLRILEIDEVKTVPDVPISHPFVERLIGTIRREFLDHVPFWTKRDLERKLSELAEYYNRERAHRAPGGQTPIPLPKPRASLHSIRWQSRCRRLYQLHAAA